MAPLVFLQILSLLCLSLAMDKHFKLIFKKKSNARISTILRFIGWLGLALSIFYITKISLPVGLTIIYYLCSASLIILLMALFYLYFTPTPKVKKKQPHY